MHKRNPCGTGVGILCIFQDFCTVFDAATLREEMAAIEQKLQNSRDPKLVNMWIMYSRKLREAEQRENGYVTARSSVTGY